MNSIVDRMMTKLTNVPGLASILYISHGMLTRYYVNLYTEYLNRNHEAVIDPYFLFEISPDRITHEVSSQFWYQPVSKIKGGEWDQETIQFEEHFFYCSLKDHFDCDVPWEETELYKRKIHQLQVGKINQNRYGTNESDILNRLRKIDKLYATIRDGGYKTQRQLRRYSSEVETQREHLPPELFEIAVNIDRNGKWLFDDGRHRLTIAKLLNIEKVPVRILVRHKKWQNKRNLVALGDDDLIAPTILDHKDIQTLRHP